MLGQRARGGRRIEPHASAEEVQGIEAPQHQVRVGDGRSRAAARVARGAGLRARALRADAQRAGRVHRGDAAAARPDLGDVDHRDLDRQRLRVAADQGRAARQRLAAVDHAGLRGRAAHVEGDRVFEPERPAERAGADDPRGGAGLQHAHALLLGLPGLVQAAGGLDEQEAAAEPRLRDMGVDAAHVLAHARADIRVRGDGRAALELAVLAR